jgi:hypothetical protein
MFATEYLKKNNRSALIESAIEPEVSISVVIPCFREPDIIETLNSLKDCILPNCRTEVIIVINHPENSPDEIKNFNIKTKLEIDNWINANNSRQLHFYAVGPVEFGKKWAGAGLARKTGMDEAVLRFNQTGKKSGIIVSIDADTVVDKNYLVEIEKHFANNPSHVGATISFEHQKTGLDAKHHEGIKLYEQYLHYYKNALKFAGYPNSMFTIGSAFAVTAEAYVKRGGMNRRQAGEDFYFLQNLAQIGIIGEITTTRVHPSARLSDRVPFGTGPILQKWIDGAEDLTKTFNFEAFTDLKILFNNRYLFFGSNEDQLIDVFSTFPKPVYEFLIKDEFIKEIDDLNKNCSNLKSFNARFYQKFNAFKILKFLNFTHEKHYKKADLKEQIHKFENQQN